MNKLCSECQFWNHEAKKHCSMGVPNMATERIESCSKRIKKRACQNCVYRPTFDEALCGKLMSLHYRQEYGNCDFWREAKEND